jgi:hypothetical protein
MSGANAPDIAAAYKLDERVRRIERHLRIEPAGN